MDSKINTKIDILSQKANSFINSNLSLFVFVGGMFLIGVLNLLLFGLVKDYSIVTSWWGEITKDSYNSWLGWFEICFSTFGSSLTIWGVVLTLRFNKKFIFPLLVGEIIVVIDAIILGWAFTAFSYILMIISAIYNYFKWSNEENNLSKMNTFQWILVFGFVLMYSIFGLSLLSSFNEGLTFLNYNDVISSGIVVASWYVILRKSKWGFLTFVITDIFYIVAYSISGVPVTGFSYLIYLFIDSTSLLSWWSLNKNFI